MIERRLTLGESTRRMAAVLCAEEPALCACMEAALRAGIQAETILDRVTRRAQHHLVPSLAWCYLCTVDPDFELRERSRRTRKEAS